MKDKKGEVKKMKRLNLPAMGILYKAEDGRR